MKLNNRSALLYISVEGLIHVLKMPHNLKMYSYSNFYSLKICRIIVTNFHFLYLLYEVLIFENKFSVLENMKD